MKRVFAYLMLVTLPLAATDPYCPAYPSSQRTRDQEAIQRERMFAVSRGPRIPAYAYPASSNFIDDYLFKKMSDNGVPIAAPATDAEFLRRVSIDLTGRIPSVDQVTAFLSDTNPNKRTAIVDQIMGSSAFVDEWTAFYANQFQVTSRFYNFIGIPGRNLFYNYLREFIAKDRPYNQVASEMISSSGDSFTLGPINFQVRNFQQGDPVQDTWDYATNTTTTIFLGVKTECTSCHNGSGHLEPINLYLSTRKRTDFWKMSAFFSRMSMRFKEIDAFGQQNRVFISDLPTGAYTGTVDPNNPGPRPLRQAGPFNAAYEFGGQLPVNGNWRQELAKMITSDRQFAKATVNYIWARLFTVGIVDPPDGWDLSRQDPKNPPPAPWTVQPSHPELLEALANEFINSNYSVRHMIRLMATSTAYGLSPWAPPGWQASDEGYYAKRTPRRMTAEEIYDSLITATMTETPMFVEGFDQPLTYAAQLPDPSEPRQDNRISTLLSNFGRGDWLLLTRNSQASVLQVLYLMNDSEMVFRSFGNQGLTTRVGLLCQQPLPASDAIVQLYLGTLGRPPNASEWPVLLGAKSADYQQWLSDIQWALINKLDFVFNY